MPEAGLNRSQAFAANAAAIGKNSTATLAGVAAQKAMLPLTADAGRLILTFHAR
jgi:hypothetical protein